MSNEFHIDDVSRLVRIHMDDVQLLEHYSEKTHDYMILRCESAGLEGMWRSICFPLDPDPEGEDYAVLNSMARSQLKQNRRGEERALILMVLPTGSVEIWAYRPDVSRDWIEIQNYKKMRRIS